MHAGSVRESWLCDEGRLAYKAINAQRLTRALTRQEGAAQETGFGAALGEAANLMSASRGKILGIVSASATLEEAGAFLKLVKGLGGEVFYARRKKGKDDSLLRRADRDSNLRGMSQLGISELKGQGIVNAELLVVLESLYSEKVSGAQGKKMVVLSPILGGLAEGATVSLPVASYAENAGTFVNFEGKAQSFAAALALKGDAGTGVEVLRQLAQKLGVEI